MGPPRRLIYGSQVLLAAPPLILCPNEEITGHAACLFAAELEGAERGREDGEGKGDGVDSTT